MATLSGFPLLSDIEQEVLYKLDQPSDEPGSPAFRKEEWVRAFNRAYQYIWARMSDLDVNWGMKIASVTTTANSRTVDLSAITDLRALRHVAELDSSGEEIRHWRIGNFSDIGAADYSVIYQKDQDQLYLTRATASAVTLRIVYNYVPVALAHGTVVTAGLTQTQLASYEQSLDSALVGQTIYIYGSGAAAGQSKAITAWDGETKTATHTAWSTTPSIGDYYTTRPNLPLGARDAFIYDVCAYLADKHADERLGLFVAEREKHLDALQRETVRHERAEELVVRDPLGFARIGDPIEEYYS